jgi:hypothetical protein
VKVGGGVERETRGEEGTQKLAVPLVLRSMILDFDVFLFAYSSNLERMSML